MDFAKESVYRYVASYKNQQQFPVNVLIFSHFIQLATTFTQQQTRTLIVPLGEICVLTTTTLMKMMTTTVLSRRPATAEGDSKKSSIRKPAARNKLNEWVLGNIRCTLLLLLLLLIAFHDASPLLVRGMCMCTFSSGLSINGEKKIILIKTARHHIIQPANCFYCCCQS